MPQSLLILEYLQQGNSITPLIALQLFGSLRLSERIRELEREGNVIEHIPVKVGKKHVMSYSLMRVAYG